MSANTYLPGTLVSPASLVITAITRSFPMIVTVSTTIEYLVGMLVYFSVPETYGMFQLDMKTGQILALSPTTMSIDIDSRPFDAFVIPSTGKERPASLAPSGSRSLQYSNSTTILPFHSASNTGN